MLYYAKPSIKTILENNEQTLEMVNLQIVCFMVINMGNLY